MLLNSSGILQQVICFSLLSLNDFYIRFWKKKCQRFKRPFCISFVLQWKFHVCLASTWRHYCRNPRQIQPITSKKQLRRRLGTGFLKEVKTFEMYYKACVFLFVSIYSFWLWSRRFYRVRLVACSEAIVPIYCAELTALWQSAKRGQNVALNNKVTIVRQTKKGFMMHLKC